MLPGTYGVVTFTVPVDSVVDLLTPKMRQLLGYAPQTPEASPTPTTAPPEVGGAPGEVDCAQVPYVALTFDDGPSVYTEGLLDLLRAAGARATFFVLGKSARVQPQTLLRMAQEGHEIGNHSWSHLNLVGLTPDEVHAQIDQTNALVAEITGAAPRTVRPPMAPTTTLWWRRCRCR